MYCNSSKNCNNFRHSWLSPALHIYMSMALWSLFSVMSNLFCSASNILVKSLGGDVVGWVGGGVVHAKFPP